MRIAVTGFVAEAAGSIASANAVLLRGLLMSGVEVDFFSKASFVDPRPVVIGCDGFRFCDVTNRFADSLRCRTATLPVISSVTGIADARTYNRLLVRTIRQAHRYRKYDAVLWMGDYAAGSVLGVPTISFVQGPTGTDARSVIDRTTEIRALAGAAQWLKWWLLAVARLSKWGLPSFSYSDHFIVGSQWSASAMKEWYGVSREKISTLGYPIDLELFRPHNGDRRVGNPLPLRALWLGRVVPRKRLDLFLQGAELAIKSGINLQLTIVGQIGFIPGYEKLIERFAFPNRLTWIRSTPRADVPDLMSRHDVLVQPSDHEDFGSSVAEAQACGLPVIVGATNGNRDYLCERDIHLQDDTPKTLELALREFGDRKLKNRLGNVRISREHAERCFSSSRACEELCGIINQVIHRGK